MERGAKAPTSTELSSKLAYGIWNAKGQVNDGIDKSAIAKHAWTKDHLIRWDASRTMELVVKDVICIQTTPESSHFNRDGRYDIPNCWIATYRKLWSGTRTGHTHPSAS